MLFDQFGKVFHLPATAIQIGGGEGSQTEMFGKEDKQLCMFGIVELHAPKMDRIVLTVCGSGQYDSLFAAQSGCLVDRMRIAPPPLEIGLSTSEKEASCLIENIEPGEVVIAPIHDIEAACLEDHLIEDIDIVQLAVRNMDEGRNISLQIEERMQLDCTFVFAKTSLGNGRQTQIDGCRIEGIDRLFQLQAKAVSAIQLARRLDQTEGEVLVNAPVAGLVGVGQSNAGDSAANP